MGWVQHAQLMELLAAGLEGLTREGLRLFVTGFARCANHRQADKLIERLQRGGWIDRDGRGSNAKFRITATAHELAPAIAPWACWHKPWDGAWRVVTFDLPEVRRKDRQRLWRALRERKLGLLQRSVWVWPHDVASILKEIIQVEGVPECFCGFEARRLFLCTNAEIVTSAWDFEEIARRQRVHLNHSLTTRKAVKAATDLNKLATLARIEWQAYEDAFSLDPLLSRELIPRSYQGEAVQRRHEDFRHQCRRRIAELA